MSEEELAERIACLEKAVANCVLVFEQLAKDTLAALNAHHQFLNTLGERVNDLQIERLRQQEDFFNKLLFWAETVQQRPM